MSTYFIILILNAHSIYAQTSSNSTCSPSSCSSTCYPTCDNGKTCILKTMKQCGICPETVCVSSNVIEIPKKTSSNGIGVLVGGIVGGLIGVGILVGLAVYFYFKYNNKKRIALPFVTVNTLPSLKKKGTQKSNTTRMMESPHPAIVVSDNPQNSSPGRITKFTKSSHLQEKQRKDQERNMLGNNYLLNINRNNDNQDSNISLSNRTNSSSNIRNSLSFAASSSLSDIPEKDLVRTISIQNKRISEILQSNPRLSYNQSYYSGLQLPAQSQRNTISDYTTEDDDDQQSVTSESTTHSEALSRVSSVRQQQNPVAVQIGRAKPQVMRFDAIRASNISKNSAKNETSGISANSTTDDEIDSTYFPTSPPRKNHQIRENPFEDTN